MRFTIKILVFTIFFVIAANGQNKLNFDNSFAKEILSPSVQDVSDAKNQGFEAFKILPRGMFSYEDNELSVRGGGAYYSFVKNSHSYNETPQIELQEENLSVGFYGASYGFIAHIGETALNDINKKTAQVNFLINYKVPKNMLEARIEQRKSNNFKVANASYKRNIPAIVGHSYVLRAISFGEADTLVAFKIHRKNIDGSLIIFWKLIKNFETPSLERNKTVKQAK